MGFARNSSPSRWVRCHSPTGKELQPQAPPRAPGQRSCRPARALPGAVHRRSLRPLSSVGPDPTGLTWGVGLCHSFRFTACVFEIPEGAPNPYTRLPVGPGHPARSVCGPRWPPGPSFAWPRVAINNWSLFQTSFGELCMAQKTGPCVFQRSAGRITTQVRCSS